jgi:hypothetical protein
MIEASPIGAAGVGTCVGASVSAPGGLGGAVDAWAALIGRSAPTVPSTVEAKKWRLPINGRSPGMILLLFEMRD